MSSFEEYKQKMGQKIGDYICQKYGIKTRRIERKNDLLADNLSIVLGPSKRKIKIK